MAVADTMHLPTTTLDLTPEAFPIRWENPDDADLQWMREAVTLPSPLTPMTYSVMAETFVPGQSQAIARYGFPGTLRCLRINTYMYRARDLRETTPEDLTARLYAYEVHLEEAMTQACEWWVRDLLPEVKEYLAFWEGFDLQAASMASLGEHLEETCRRARRFSEIETYVSLPRGLAMSIFEDLYQELFGSDARWEGLSLLRGFDNKTLETNRALWRLSRAARAVPEVQELLAHHDADGAMQAMQARATSSPTVRDFLADLRVFLAEYGQRDYTFRELAVPSWIENPAPVLAQLRGLVRQSDGDPDAQLRAHAAERLRLVDHARRQLQGFPQAVIDRFEALLKAAQEGTAFSEDHNFWIDGRGWYQVRRVLLEWGRRLAGADAIEVTDDVFYLTLDELRAIARRSADDQPAGDLRSLVSARKAEMAHFRAVTPPRMLGTPRTETIDLDLPVNRALGKFYGGFAKQDDDPCLVRGFAASAGTARGPARVATTLQEAVDLRPGEVLVTITTSPEWTPLFSTAAAIVTDAGGPICHCAIVAREYGLPAVVGTGVATSRIRTGQILEVDGAAGLVRIVIDA